MSVYIYGAPGCIWCERAKDLAKQYDLEFTYVDVKENIDNQKAFRMRFPDAKTIPQIVWNGNHIGGYTEFATEIENTRNYGDGQV